MNAQNHPTENCSACPAQVFCKQFGSEKADELPFDVHELSRQHDKRYVAVARWMGITHQGIIYIPITEEAEIHRLREAIQQEPLNIETACQTVFTNDPRLEFVMMQLHGEVPWQKQGKKDVGLLPFPADFEFPETGPGRMAKFMSKHVPSRGSIHFPGFHQAFAHVKLTPVEVAQLPEAVNQARAAVNFPPYNDFSLENCTAAELLAALEIIWNENDPRWDQILHELEASLQGTKSTEQVFCRRKGNILHIALWRFELDALTNAMTELHIQPSDDGKMGRGQILSAFNLSGVWQISNHPGWKQLMDVLDRDDTRIFTVIFEVQPLVFLDDVENLLEARLTALQAEFQGDIGSVVDQANEALEHQALQIQKLQRQNQRLQSQIIEILEELERRTLHYKISRWWHTSSFSPLFWYELVKRLHRIHKAEA